MAEKISIGELFNQYGQDYVVDNNVSGQEKGIIRLLSYCRTADMGSHFEQCSNCNYIVKAYNSCRNRHCPTCQQKDKLEWMDKRMKELLPVGYYHLVFTIPHLLNNLCLQNKKLMYGLLFKAASQTILELCKDPKHLGGDTGLITVLHTWGQNMMEHPHLHCIIPAGGLSFDKSHWVYPRKAGNFFIHHKVLSRKFRGKFLALLNEIYQNKKLEFKGRLTEISGKRSFFLFTESLRKKEWVVNIQKPIGSAEKILEYLSRYVFRIAISDRRIKKVENGKVHFTWKDNRKGGLFRHMKLDIDEFIRRFLLHVLPRGFFKVRYYGIFANKCRKENINTARQVLQQEKQDNIEQNIEDGIQVYEKQDTVWKEILACIRNFQKPNCPKCKKGRMLFAGIVRDGPWKPG